MNLNRGLDQVCSTELHKLTLSFELITVFIYRYYHEDYHEGKY